MFGLGTFELVIILAMALIFLGPKRLPQLAKSIGKGVREFQRFKDDIVNNIEDKPNIQEELKEGKSSNSEIEKKTPPRPSS